MDYTERPLTPALSPPAATARQRGESEGERENPRQLTGVGHVTDSSVSTWSRLLFCLTPEGLLVRSFPRNEVFCFT